jgi:hypothetical protein
MTPIGLELTPPPGGGPKMGPKREIGVPGVQLEAAGLAGVSEEPKCHFHVWGPGIDKKGTFRPLKPVVF